MTTRSYADEQQEKHPLEFEQARLVIDATTALKQALEDQGLSISELARRLGRGRAILSRQLSAQENLTLEKLAELAFHLGKRFEIGLVNMAQRELRGSTMRHEPLAWSPVRGGSLRVVVQESLEPEDAAPVPYMPAA
jgi:transcriptional regulator with XRE-family HTH domain